LINSNIYFQIVSPSRIRSTIMSHRNLIQNNYLSKESLLSLHPPSSILFDILDQQTNRSTHVPLPTFCHHLKMTANACKAKTQHEKKNTRSLSHLRKRRILYTSFRHEKVLLILVQSSACAFCLAFELSLL